MLGAAEGVPTFAERSGAGSAGSTRQQAGAPLTDGPLSGERTAQQQARVGQALVRAQIWPKEKLGRPSAIATARLAHWDIRRPGTMDLQYATTRGELQRRPRPRRGIGPARDTGPPVLRLATG